MRVGFWNDHPDLTSGFANVGRPILAEMIDRGWDVTMLACTGDKAPKGTHPFRIWEPGIFDAGMGGEGVDQFEKWILGERPDIIFCVRSPGDLARWIFYQTGIKHMWERTFRDLAIIPHFPLVAYMPIEGEPQPRTAAYAFEFIKQTGGKSIFYSPGALEAANRYWSTEGTWAYHGLDHASFRPYPKEDRDLIRTMLGLQDYFIVGTVGVNKKTKGLPEVIYTAQQMKLNYPNDKVLFYLHTAPEDPVNQGHDLITLIKHYDVADKILTNPRLYNMEGRGLTVLNGIEVNRGETIGWLKDLLSSNGEPPSDPHIRRFILQNLSYIDLLNIFDLYFDTSQVEGWGLPVGEAMACGIPVLGVEDKAIRDEIYGEARMTLSALDPYLWPTNSTGARLAIFSPQNAAFLIHEIFTSLSHEAEIKRSGYMSAKLAYHIQKGLDLAAHYTWKPTAIKICDIIEECYAQNQDRWREGKDETLLEVVSAS